ncbi:putative mitochondrial N(5)-glutamine methyltransferase mtq1 [Cytospora mali]|uniref:Mitochondrial N(5)-glutamine methyltransferase mtq1 n=1 Tax=Cytospora mali TaxID=578113 RepID=A0A194UMD8_CYTMA|nr:putative mitochondrial N(5)-glutamine methyltransferase mtq1 [Valsa mali var. pyri (nom. inval.)]
MPRISPTALRRAHQISPHAATLLPAVRDLPSALNELRWIREHVQQLRQEQQLLSSVEAERKVASLCRRRGRGVPLQYVLGTQPFGNLDMKCRPGVLIPRPEPEAYTTHLANLIKYGSLLGKPSPSTLRVLDFCTGTGCIALLLYSLLHRTIPNLHAQGIDISPHAVQLARENARYNISRDLMPSPTQQKSLAFTQADIFADTLLEDLARQDPWDIIVCNPPYISHWGFAHQTARDVRNYEPKLAQVPMVAYDGGGDHEPEDVFYARLLDIGARLKPRLMLFEVGDLKQALRVVEMALRHKGLSSTADGAQAEVWRDWPDATPEEDEETSATICIGSRQVIRGSGHSRSVFIKCR